MEQPGIEGGHSAIEIRTMSLRKPNRHWNIPLTSISDHLYGKTKSRNWATNKCINNRILGYDFLGFGYVGC